MAKQTTTKPTDPENPVRWTVASLVRIIVPLAIGWLGLEVASSTTEEIIAGVTLIVWTVVSLWMSVRGRSKLLGATPPQRRPR